MTIKINDTVRSFDFAETLNDGTQYGRDLTGERASYVVGRVEGVEWHEGCDRYKIKVACRVFGGKVLPQIEAGDYVFPPLNGTPKLSGVCDGVEKI